MFDFIRKIKDLGDRSVGGYEFKFSAFTCKRILLLLATILSLKKLTFILCMKGDSFDDIPLELNWLIYVFIKHFLCALFTRVNRMPSISSESGTFNHLQK